MRTYNHTTPANETLCFFVIYHVRRLVRIDEHDVKGRLELGQGLRRRTHNDFYFIGEACRAYIFLRDLHEIRRYLVREAREYIGTLAHLVDSSRVMICPSAGSPRANQTVENLWKWVIKRAAAHSKTDITYPPKVPISRIRFAPSVLTSRFRNFPCAVDTAMSGR